MAMAFVICIGTDNGMESRRSTREYRHFMGIQKAESSTFLLIGLRIIYRAGKCSTNKVKPRLRTQGLSTPG